MPMLLASPRPLSLLEMSGLSFHIASLDESGVLNVWVSGAHGLWEQSVAVRDEGKGRADAPRAARREGGRGRGESGGWRAGRGEAAVRSSCALGTRCSWRPARPVLWLSGKTCSCSSQYSVFRWWLNYPRQILQAQ